MPAQHTLANITLGTTVSSDELWNGFWKLSSFFSSYVCFNEDYTSTVYFGTGPDNTATSKNLKPHKVRFGPGGHDHSGLFRMGAVLSPTALSKQTFDLNSVNVLWYDLFGEGHRGRQEEEYGSKTPLLMAGNSGTTIPVDELPEMPSDPGTAYEFLLDGSEDTAWTNFETVGYIISPRAPASDDTVDINHVMLLWYDTSVFKYKISHVGWSVGTAVSYIWMGYGRHA